MFMVGRVPRRFEATKPFAEIAFHDETAFDQDVEGTVDGGRADRAPTRTRRIADVIRREMPVCREDDLCDGEPLLRDRQVAFTQEGFESAQRAGVVHTPSMSAARRSSAPSRSGST